MNYKATVPALAICFGLTGFIVLPDATAADDDWRSKCASIARMSEQIMKSRQAGIPMAKMMEIPTGELKDLASSLVIHAYDTPRYSTEKMQQRAVEDFRDEAYLRCAKASTNKRSS